MRAWTPALPSKRWSARLPTRVALRTSVSIVLPAKQPGAGFEARATAPV